MIVGVREEAKEKARRFATTAYHAKNEALRKENDEKIRQFRAQQASKGVLRSGFTIAGIAKLKAEFINNLLDARLDALVEGYDLHEVPIDDSLAGEIINDLRELHGKLAQNFKKAVQAGIVSQFDMGKPQILENAISEHAPFHLNHYKTELDRKRLGKQSLATSVVTNIYHLDGPNSRVNVNSTDASVNSVTVTEVELFQDIRAKLMDLPEGGERDEILAKLQALEESKEQPSFGKRYTEFIAAAANHITVIAPFLPALTELLHRVI